jgi:hypothetical protein
MNLLHQSRPSLLDMDLQQDTEDTTHKESEEAETVLSHVEAVILNEDEWEGLELSYQLLSL